MDNIILFSPGEQWLLLTFFSRCGVFVYVKKRRKGLNTRSVEDRFTFTRLILEGLTIIII